MTVKDFRTTQPLPSDARVVREVERVVGAHRQREGGGFMVRRPVPTVGLMQVDPFLLIDEMGPVDYSPGQAVGAPDHPHRGFETVTYMLDGEMEHEDSAGHRVSDIAHARNNQRGMTTTTMNGSSRIASRCRATIRGFTTPSPATPGRSAQRSQPVVVSCSSAL